MYADLTGHSGLLSEPIIFEIPVKIMLFQRRIILFAAVIFTLLGQSQPILAAPTPMNEQKFLQLVETVKKEAGSSIESRPAVLQKRLSSLEPGKFKAFSKGMKPCYSKPTVGAFGAQPML